MYNCVNYSVCRYLQHTRKAAQPRQFIIIYGKMLMVAAPLLLQFINGPHRHKQWGRSFTLLTHTLYTTLQSIDQDLISINFFFCFFQILRSHVMVRVGGGWDTLSHYLDKHDPCRCRARHRPILGGAMITRPNGKDLMDGQVFYNR